MFCDYNGRKHYSAKGRSLIGVEQQAVKKQDKKSRDGLQAIWNDDNNQRKEHKGKNLGGSIKIVCTKWIYGHLHE